MSKAPKKTASAAKVDEAGPDESSVAAAARPGG